MTEKEENESFIKVGEIRGLCVSWLKPFVWKPLYSIYMSLTMNNMVGVVEEAGTANLSEAPEFTQFLCCCSIFLFIFLCDVVLCWSL
jgi:hypothetical protein